MEDGLSLSLGLKGFEKSPPPPAPLATSLPQMSWIKKPFFVKNVDNFFRSSLKVDGSRTQPPPNTALNLGYISSIPDMKIESQKSESSDTARKRSIERVVIIDDDEDGEGGSRSGGGERKKLRLTKEQSAVLEQTFMNQSTLNTNQKASLAKELNLKPRQVEVWFQNRRARTKLKQTEVDCEYLRKYCERLYDENKRLHEELEELARAGKNSPAADSNSNKKAPTTTLTLCPVCTRTAASSSSSASPTADGAVGVPYHAAAPFRRPSTLFPNKGALLKI